MIRVTVTQIMVAARRYRVAKIHRVRYNVGHFLQISLQLLVKLAENDLYYNEPYESSPPRSSLSYMYQKRTRFV